MFYSVFYGPAAAAALPDITGSGGAVIPIAANGVGDVAVHGAGGAALSITAGGTGSVHVTGFGNVTVSPVGAAGAGKTAVSGSGAVSLPLAESGAGDVAIAGHGDGRIPLSAHGVGSVAITGTGDAKLPLTAAGGDAAEPDPPPPPPSSTASRVRPVRRGVFASDFNRPVRTGRGDAVLAIAAGGRGSCAVRGAGDAHVPLGALGAGNSGRDPIEELRILLAA